MSAPAIFRLVWILFLSTPLLLVGQSRDTAAVWEMLDQANAMDSLDEAREKYEMAYALANEMKYEKGILVSLENLIEIALERGNTSAALRYLLAELELREKYNKVEQLGRVNIEIGDLYSREYLYPEAIVYYKKAEQLLRTSGLAAPESLYDKMGESYTQMDQPDSASLYYKRLQKFKPGDDAYRVSILHKIVSAYQKTKQYESTLGI